MVSPSLWRLALIAVIVAGTKAFVIPSETEPACPGIQCQHAGVLDYTSCTCSCRGPFSGLFCETVVSDTKWPRGKYSLLSTLFGCPEDDSHGWLRGYINMSLPATKPHQRWKVPFVPTDQIQNTPDPHLLGPYHFYNLQLNFCTRLEQTQDDNGTSEDNVDWPSGDYCLFKAGHTCMEGFIESSVTLVGYGMSWSSMDGTLPNITLDTNTSQLTLAYCCRNDTNMGTSLDLPSDYPFLLLKLNGSSCPKVSNMKVTEERFDLVDDLDLFRSEGHHEILMEVEEYKRLGLCYYAATAVRECFFKDDYGFSYLGTMNVSATGLPCQDWFEADPSYNPGRHYYGDGFGENHCRTSTPWGPSPTVPRCYVNDTGEVSLEECNVPICEGDPAIEEVGHFKPVYSAASIDDRGAENSVDRSKIGAPFVAERPQRKPWIQIDLEEILEVHAVRVHRKFLWFPSNFRFAGVHVGINRWDFINYGAQLCEDRRNPRYNPATTQIARSVDLTLIQHQNDVLKVFLKSGQRRADHVCKLGSHCWLDIGPAKAKVFRFNCYRPIAGQYVTIRNFDDPDPDSTWGKFYVMEISEIEVLIKRDWSVCKRRMGLLSGEVRDFQVSGSKDVVEAPFNNGRILVPAIGWCSDQITDQYFLVDLIAPSVVSGLELQGWLEAQTVVSVEQFTVQYAVHQDQYWSYTDQTGQPKIFEVDTSEAVSTIVRFMFMKDIVARYVKINILKYTGKPCLKLELIGCPKRVIRDLYCANDTEFYGYDVIDRAGFWMEVDDDEAKNMTLTACTQHCDDRDNMCVLFTHIADREDNCVAHKSTRYNPHYAHWLVPKLHEYNLVATKLCVKDVQDAKQCHDIIREPVQLSSPSYPFYYGQLLDCVWHVNFPEGLYSRITIKDIDLNPPDTLTQLKENGIYDVSPGSCKDMLMIDELMITPDNQAQYIGAMTVSSQSSVTIHFSSCARYSVANARGFLLDIEYSESPGCVTSFFEWFMMCVMPSALIYSPFYPAQFSKNEAGRWLIGGEDGQYIKLRFIEMDIRSFTLECDLSYVRVLDVSQAFTKTTIDKYCSHNRPIGTIKSSWQALEIEFVTTDEAEGRGFLAEYELVDYIQEWTNETLNATETDCIGWEAYGDSCYQIFAMDTGLTWLAAESTCQEEGGHLVSLSSMEEVEFIHSLLLREILNESYPNTALDYYIGLRKLDTSGRYDNYQWSDGSPLTYTAWYKNASSGQSQPDGLENERCTQLRMYSIHSSRDWHDVACAYDKIQRFICEKSVDTAQTSNRTIEYYLPTSADVSHFTLMQSTHLFKCTNTEYILTMYCCDGHKDCLDGSDEICDESKASCSEGFQCTSGQCISAAAYCDFQLDCQDGSDENNCVYAPCLPWEWRCVSGQCISTDHRCDVKQDCYDGSDEDNCDTCHSSSFQCYDQRCITSSRVCDSNNDCSGRFYEDESQNCSVISQPTCAEWYTIGTRKNGSYLIDAGVGNPFPVECVFIESSEVSTVLVQTILHHEYESEMDWRDMEMVSIDLTTTYPGNIVHYEALKERSQCKQYVKIECSYTTRAINVHGWLKAVSNRDTYENCSCPYVGNCEDICNCSLSLNSDWYGFPHDVSLTDSGYVTDQFMLPIEYLLSDTLVDPFLPNFRTTIGPFICEQEIIGWSISDTFVCTNDKLASESDRCILEIDEYGATQGCQDLSHLHDCATSECPDSHARCPDGYCVPLHLLCDGTEHCSNGEDELNCDANPACQHAFHCRHSNICIELTKVCDNFKHCPYGDDEQFCDIQCPEPDCMCFQNQLFCRLREFLTIPQHMYIETFDSAKEMSFVRFDGGVIPQLKNNTFYNMPYLIALNMTMVGISQLYSYQFANNKNLIKLDISYNFIEVLESNTFYGLNRLELLYLHGNPLHQIHVDAFQGLSVLAHLDLSDFNLNSLAEGNFNGLENLEVLNLSSSELALVPAGAFVGLMELEILDIRYNDISKFDEGIFIGLKTLEKLYSSAFTMCCLRPSSVKEKDCLPAKDEFSSCDDLMRNQVLRAFLWIIGLLALFGNFAVLLYRFIVDRENLNKSYSIFVTNLGVADFLMGVYLIILAVADTAFRGRYVWNDHLWRNGIACKLAGVLSTLGSEGSVLFLCLITLDRFLVVKFPFGNVKISRNLCFIFCLGTWMLILLFALAPLSTGPYFQGKFYSRSAVCLALPLTRDRPAGWEYSTGVFIVFNLMAFMLIAMGQIAIYREIYISRGRTTSSGRRHDITIARNLFMVATTDFLCWFPVGVMGVMALNGQVIAGEVYAWIAVFVLPINSALNPFIYTIGATLNKARVGRSIRSLRKRSSLKDRETSDITEVINCESFNFGDVNVTGRIPLEDLFQKRTITVKESLLLAWQMARCLHHLHSVDMYHGNLTIDKLMVKPTQQGLSKVALVTRPKLCQTDEDLATDVKDLGETLRQILKQNQLWT